MFRRCCTPLSSSVVVRNAYGVLAQRNARPAKGSESRKRDGAIKLPTNPMDRVRTGYAPPVAPAPRSGGGTAWTPRFTGIRMLDGPRVRRHKRPSAGARLGSLADSFKQQDAENKRLREEGCREEGATPDNGYPQPPPLRTPSSQEAEEGGEAGPARRARAAGSSSPQPQGDYRTLLAAVAARCDTGGGGGGVAAALAGGGRRGALIDDDDDDDGEVDDIFWGSRGRADDASALVLRHRRDRAATATATAAQAQAPPADDDDVDAPFFPSPTAAAQPRVGAAEAAALLAAGGARPVQALQVLEDVTEARCSLSDEALTVVLEAVAADLADAGAAATQKERYAAGVRTLERLETLCERHEAGTRSASAMLLCAACAAVPSRAMRLFRQFAVEDKVRLSTAACNTYLRLLVAFDMVHEARDDAVAALQVGATVDHALYRRLLDTSNGRKAVHSHQSTSRISRRMHMDTKTKFPHNVKILT